MTAEPDLVPLRIHVCVNCMNRVPGECHAPGCFYWLHQIDEVPSHLEAYVVPEQDADVRALEVGRKVLAGEWACGEECAEREAGRAVLLENALAELSRLRQQRDAVLALCNDAMTLATLDNPRPADDRISPRAVLHVMGEWPTDRTRPPAAPGGATSAADAQPARHFMLPGSHERPRGAECRCGQPWFRVDNACRAQLLAVPTPADPTETP